MGSNYIFTNNVSAVPVNPNVGYNNSWVKVDNNAGRELFAQASYITNFDGLTVSLTAGNVNIGDVHIADAVTGLHAGVANIGVGLGALRVLTQDFDSIHDSVSIGDKKGINFASIQPSTSALTTYDIGSRVTNWDVLSAAVNASTYTTFPSNPADEITVLNNTGNIIYIKNAAKTIGLPIDNNTSFDIKLVGNTNEVAVMASSNNKTVYATFIAYN
jgi:hypothetical protein